MFDLTAPESFRQLDSWKKGFAQYVDTSRQAKFPFVVLGNKVDLVAERRVSREEAEQWCRENGDLLYFETSGLQNVNLEEAFTLMASISLDSGADNLIDLPSSMGGIGGQITLTKKEDTQRAKLQQLNRKKKKCAC